MNIEVGARGCCAKTKRRGILRHCAQKAVVLVGVRPYCYYHDPRDPKKFGEGYAVKNGRRVE